MTTNTETTTLHDGIEAHLDHLKAIGKKASTVGTAKRTLELLEEHLGSGKVIAKIMPVHIAGFFKSEAATLLKGKPRAEASVLQIRRIVRSALVWWHEQGLLVTVPVPKEDRRYLEGRRASAETEADQTQTTVQTEPSIKGA